MRACWFDLYLSTRDASLNASFVDLSGGEETAVGHIRSDIHLDELPEVPIWYRIAADIVLVFHLAFILFVVLGGLLALRWPKVAWAHLPTVAYGALIEFVGWVCPLTPIEQELRRMAGEGGYAGGFIEHYLVPIIYPAGYTWELRISLGSAVVAINVAFYGWFLWSRYRRSSADDASE